MPQPTLIQTYRAALILKFVGVLVGILTGAILIQELELPIERWWFAGLNTLLTLALIWLPIFGPFDEVAGKMSPKTYWITTLALALGIFFPNIELILVSYDSFEELLTYVSFVELLRFSESEVNSIHAYSQFFMMIPVVLATWRDRYSGLLWSLGLAGAAYAITFFLVDDGSINQSLYVIRGFVMLGVVLILAFTTYYLVEAQLKEADKLRAANQKLAEQALVIEELAISRERNRMARELHDTLAHTLSGTAVHLQAVKTLMSINPEEAADALKTAQTQIKAGLRESREAIGALRASPLEEHGLKDAIKFIVQEMGERNGWQIDCKLEHLPSLTSPQEHGIYRITQEALTNIEKHAKANHVTVSAGPTDRGFAFEIADDGIGLRTNGQNGVHRENGTGFGMLGMRERAELIGATFEVSSQLGKGTMIKCIVPQHEAT